MIKNQRSLSVAYKLLKSSFEVKIFKTGKYSVGYPAKVFKQFPARAKNFLLDNFIYSRTVPFSLFNYRFLDYQTAQPAFKKFIDSGFIKSLPDVGDSNNLSIKKLVKKFKSFQAGQGFVFSGPKIITSLPPLKSFPNKVVLALSFGKDSLLSYALARELKLNYLLVTCNEMANHSGDEWKIKSSIIKRFTQEQKEKIYFFRDNVDELFYHQEAGQRLKEASDANGILAYSLELLPFAYYHHARYLIFGNERNLDDFFYTPDGFKFYPSYDQSSGYTRQENQSWDKLTNNSFRVISFLEPLYNLAEMRILYHRYPHLLKYLMSCEPNKGSPDRWCYHCPMCAKAFLYSCAASGDPKKIGFNRDFFQQRFSELYPLFAKKRLRHYERPPQVREEQLLSFLLASRQGFTGDLIDLFKKKYLAEALVKESRLRRKFFGVHQAVNLPISLKAKILKIYQQELSSLY